jgi:hypothetical protein
MVAAVKALIAAALAALAATAAAHWTRIDTRHAPPAACPSAQMADTKAGVLLYTGSQTWLFKDNDWALQSQGRAPPSRSGASVSRFGEGAILFGGEDKAGFLNDSWVWTPAAGWVEHDQSACTSGPPPARIMAAMGTMSVPFIVQEAELVHLFGGATTGEPRMTALGDMWVFRDNTGPTGGSGCWFEVAMETQRVPGGTIEYAAAPPARWGHSMACPQGANGLATYCVMFGGGLTQQDHFADTWRLEWVIGESNAGSVWRQVVPVQTQTTVPPLGLPAGRWSYQMAACGSGAIMATGSTGYRVCTDDTWVWDPTPVKSPWGPLQDQNGSWTQQQPPVHPTNLGGAGMARVHDASHSGVLLFGGIVFTPNTTSIGPMMNQTWIWADSACPK